MKYSLKFSLIGSLIGAIVMFVLVFAFKFWYDSHPSLDTQVIEHLESCGYAVDTLNKDLYAFHIEGDKLIFVYYPDDPSYLRLLAGYGMEEYSADAVTKACLEVTQTKKNCMAVPDTRDGQLAVSISCESFINPDEALDTRIIDRSIRIIKESYLMLLRELLTE